MESTEFVQPSEMNHEPGMWRCLVCSKPSNQIHVLPCQHKFCDRCLKLWAMIYVDMYHGACNEFPCQICWKQWTVPAEGLSAFEQDYQVKMLEETMQNLSMHHRQTDNFQPGGPSSSPSPDRCSDQVQREVPFSSMLSHMVPTFKSDKLEVTENMASSVPDYCVRSRHMYMHLI